MPSLPPAAARPPATPEVNYLYYLEVLRKRLGILIVSFAIIFTIVAINTFHLPYFYVATSKIAFTSTAPEQIDLYRRAGPVTDYALYNPIFLKNQIEILYSDRVLRKVVRQLRLVGEEVADNAAEMQEEINRLRRMVKAEPVENSALMRITVVSGNPSETFQVARSVANAFVQDNLERQVEGFQNTLGWLTAQLQEQERKLGASQREVIHFVEKERLTSFGGEKGAEPPKANPEEENITRLLAALEADKVQAELKVARLSERYLEGHPRMIEARSELNRIVQKLQEERGRLTSVKGQIERQAIAGKRKEIQYDILKSKVDSNKELYNALIRKWKETDISGAMIKNNAAVIEEAKLPTVPAGPDKRKRLLYGLVVALIASLSLVFLWEYLDNSVRSVEDVDNYLHLPVISTIPYLKRVKGAAAEGHAHFLALGDEEAQLKEAYRSLRTNLRFTIPGRGSHSVLITSTQKGEGKSTIAANYGLVCAETGKKTIIVDCDLRIPNIHRIFNLPNTRGLTNYLAEACDLGGLIQESGIPNLMVLTSGPNPPKPTVLLESDNMIQLIPILEDDYDYVILDAPPVGMVIDTSVIAGLARSIILVIEAGLTNRYHVLKALEQLEKAKANVAGAVLNKLRFKKKQYLNYYGYAYGYGERKG